MSIHTELENPPNGKPQTTKVAEQMLKTKTELLRARKARNSMDLAAEFGKFSLGFRAERRGLRG